MKKLPLIPKIEEKLKEREFLETNYVHLLKDNLNKIFNGFVRRDNFGKMITPGYIF